MRKLVIYVGVIVFMFTMVVKHTDAQVVKGAYKRNDILQKKPMTLPTVREADVFWSKKIWRIIDLREKMNLPLYYPTVEIEGRKNLISLLIEGIETGQVTPFDADADDDFSKPMSIDEVKVSFGAEETTIERVNFETGEPETVVVPGEMRFNTVKQYMVKEEWYFDKQTSTLNVRIIGLCPIREFVREGDTSGEVQRELLFWVNYPEARPLLATNLVLNQYNEARQMSFDDLFIKRFFSSYVVQETNVYDNRNISLYLTGKDAMLESKKIESEIFNYEQDLWEY